MSASWKDIETSAEALVELAKDKKLTLSTAESCTGGGIGAAITDVSGASAVFPGGIIAYANEIKIDPLGVDKTLLAKHGAVSEAVAAEMAKGALRVFGSDFAVAVTGIAGPTGGTRSKPVGLVYIAAAQRGGHMVVKAFEFGNIGRSGVRMQTIFEALEMLNEELTKA